MPAPAGAFFPLALQLVGPKQAHGLRVCQGSLGSLTLGIRALDLDSTHSSGPWTQSLLQP